MLAYFDRDKWSIIATIGYLQTFPRTIVSDFSRKWHKIYDSHLAPVNQEYHRKSTMSLSEYIF